MQQIARLAQQVVAIVRGLVVALPALKQRLRISAYPPSEIVDRAAALRSRQRQKERGHPLKSPQAAEQRFPDALAPDRRIDHEPGLALVMFTHFIAELRAVNFLVAEAHPGSIDDHPARPRQGRIDETPRRHALEPRAFSPDRLAETYATAVAS